MARKSGSTISQEELYPPAHEPARPVPDDALDDARMLDLDVEQESPFLRGQKRVSVRRGSLPKMAATGLTWGILTLALAFLCCAAVAALYHYGEHSWRFRVESSDDIEITGLQNVTRFQVMEVMGGDIGRNIFFVPLAERKKTLEKIPWVESASVMRFVPNRLKIEIHERTPLGFARVGSRIFLIDSVGTLMDLPAAGKKKFSFPVILGMNPGEPPSTRAARMKIYNDLVSQMDAGGTHYSQDLSEVDLSDAEDVKVLANDPQGEVLVHLGSANYLERYRLYVSHVRAWRQQFDKLESVDLRYERQIIVNPDLQGTVKQAPLSMLSVKAAMAAGMKPAALITRQVRSPKSIVALTPASKSVVKVAAGKKTVKKAHHKVAAKAISKPGAFVQNKNVATNGPPASQSPAALTTSAPATSAPATSGKTTPAAPPATGTVAVKPGNKPSPAIAKGEEHP
ncbi:MAG TPA: FtsQ-type POTRA domain-containing protein [Terriglobales bacterium]|nr:FtsQ-type POTRA domain-containing protein [Terriglobales bacterium]